MNLQEQGINISFMLAGLMGALMMMSKTAGATVGRTIFATIGGAASANYLTPLILHVTKLGQDDVHFSYSIAFLLGFTGLRTIEFITSKMFLSDEHPHHHKRHR